MKAEDLFGSKGALRHKLRREEDLVLHIGTSVDSASNYTVLLGAGCSVTSGIDSGRTLINKWMKELYLQTSDTLPETDTELYDHFTREEASWFNATNPYASLFEKKFDLPSQRRRFVESEVDKKSPSIGYAYLVNLVNKRFLSTIFTTNYDDLIQEAFYQFSDIRPIMCAHDSSVRSISITSSRPKIIKLHGDYLFDDIKSTVRETESLEQNIRDKLIEFCKEFGLVVIGYSGNDRSVMDVLEFLTKQDDYLSNGLYWCLRKNDEVNNTLQNLLWRDRVYPVLIDGFDEFFASAHSRNIKEGLGIESNLNQSKIKKAIKLMIDDKHGLGRSTTIREELDRLKNMDRQTEISNFITDISTEEDSSPSLPMSDYRNILEIESTIAKGEFKKALELAEADFYEAASEKTKPPYLFKLIRVSERLGDKGGAIRWAEKLGELDPNNVHYQMRKADFLESEDKTSYVKRLNEKFPTNYRVANRYASELLQQLRHDPSKQPEIRDKLFEVLDRSIRLEPALSNYAWELKYKALKSSLLKTEGPDTDALKEHVEKAVNINPNHIQTLGLRANYAAKIKNIEDIKAIINKLYDEYESSSIERKEDLHEIMSSVHLNLMDVADEKVVKPLMRKFFESHLTDKSIEKNAELLLHKAKYHIGQTRNMDKARTYFNSSLDAPDINNVLLYVLSIVKCFDTNYLERIKKLFEQNRYKLKESTYFSGISEIDVFQENYDDALKHIERAYDSGLSISQYLNVYSYICLLDKRYDLLMDKHDRYNAYDDMDDFEAWKINYTYAIKQKGLKFNEVPIRNMSTQSSREEVKLAAFAILDNVKTAKRIMHSEIKKDYTNYFLFSTWPVLDNLKGYLNEEVAISA